MVHVHGVLLLGDTCFEAKVSGYITATNVDPHTYIHIAHMINVCDPAQ